MARDREFPLHRLAGGLIALGGAWHMVAPWVMLYSDDRSLVISNLVTGAALVVFGVLRAAYRQMAWPVWVCGAIGLWVVVAPGMLGHWERGMAMNEALWTGFGVLGLAVVLGIDRRFDVTATPQPGTRARA